MAIGLLGKKLGMTQVFDRRGRAVAASVLEVGPCFVTAIRSQEKNGYKAVQISYGEKTRKCLRKPLIGYFKKAGIDSRRYLKEIRTGQVEGLQVGQELKVNLFRAGDFVDITGATIGRGFQGVVKRHGFAGGPRSHGASMNTRQPGAIGSSTFPGRTLRGLRMGGHMGTNRVTQQNMQVIDILPEDNLMIVEGSVPGFENTLLIIRNAKKKTDPARKWEIPERLPIVEEEKPKEKAEKKVAAPAKEKPKPAQSVQKKQEKKDNK